MRSVIFTQSTLARKMKRKLQEKMKKIRGHHFWRNNSGLLKTMELCPPTPFPRGQAQLVESSLFAKRCTFIKGQRKGVKILLNTSKFKKPGKSMKGKKK